MLQYHADHKEEIAEYKRKWRLAHPGYYAKKTAEYYARNPTYLAERWKNKDPRTRRRYYLYNTEAAHFRAILLD